MAPRPLPQIWSSPSPPTIAETLLKQDPKYQNQGSSVRMKKGHESATGGQHNLTTRCCDVQYLGLVGARVWLGLGLVRLSLCLLDATYDVLAPVSPSSHYIHSMARVSAFFFGRTSKKERSLSNLCMWDLAARLAKSLPTYRKGNSTHRLLPNRLLGKNLLEQTVWEIGLDASNRWAIGNEFMAVIQYENLCCSWKKQHVTQRLIIGLYCLRMVQTAMIVMRHIKGFAVHC